jgi:integrase
MSVRKRRWTTRTGEAKEAWIVDYIDNDGDRHIETFQRKKDADAYAQQVGVGMREGTHTPASKSPTVAQAADDWLRYIEGENRERSTLAQYRNHARHISARIGTVRLGKLTTPRINAFRDELLSGSEQHPPMKSRATARKVLTSLKSILQDAQRRGTVAQNVALSVKIGVAPREHNKLRVGIDIPAPDEIRNIMQVLNTSAPRLRPLLLTAIFTGLRASELRGLRWEDIDLKRSVVHVRQRADKYHEIGKPKSRAGERSIPIGPDLVTVLREWKLACPKGELGLAFPSPKGEIDQHSNIVRKFTQVVRDVGLLDANGQPKYTGLHALRHFYASWCINRKEDGGLELPAKIVQARLGHASIVMTMDRYGHLFPSTDDGAELAHAERALMGNVVPLPTRG